MDWGPYTHPSYQTHWVLSDNYKVVPCNNVICWYTYVDDIGVSQEIVVSEQYSGHQELDEGGELFLFGRGHIHLWTILYSAYIYFFNKELSIWP